MRLPQPLLESPYFAFGSLDELASALGDDARARDLYEIQRLVDLGLPPIASIETLATIFGINSGIIWSFMNRPNKHYRIYTVPKGKSVRAIASPRVGLKIIQTWIAFHLSRAIKFADHVYGFIPGRSHIDAAFVHRDASWGYSVDIADFFGTTPQYLVANSLKSVGYNPVSASIVSRLSCLNMNLAQGSPISPVLSNLAFIDNDQHLIKIAERYNAKLTRYADDIVFSGSGEMPQSIRDDVRSLFATGPWRLSMHKERIEPLKGRIKVHGLIVNDPNVRLTKGYRNKLRAYRYMIETGKVVDNYDSLVGHLRYAEHVNDRLHNLNMNPDAFQSKGPRKIEPLTGFVEPDLPKLSIVEKISEKPLMFRMLERIRNAF